METGQSQLVGRIAIVTGAGRGIGAGIAFAYADAGADVVLFARTKSQLDEIADRVRATGQRVLVVVGDVTKSSDVTNLVERTFDEFGGLDVLVNNVGGAMPGPLLETTGAQLSEAFALNVTATFELSKLAAPYLLASKFGSIVNISSSYDRMPARGMIVYGTVKAAASQLTRLLAAELAPKVRVNAISPGNIETEGMRSVLNDEIRSRILAATPLRRLGRVEDVAAAAVWLASSEASFMTGKVIELTGGADAPTFPNDLPDL